MCSDFKRNTVTATACLMLYVINRFSKFYDASENIIKYIWDYNFSDFLCVILNLSLANLALAILKKEGIYNARMIMILSVFSCFIWEVFVCWLNDKSTFDILDCIAYMAGGAVYYYLMKYARNSNCNDE